MSKLRCLMVLWAMWNSIYYRVPHLRITSLSFMNNSLVFGSSHIPLYKLRFLFYFIHHLFAWYPFSISYTIDFLVSSLSIVTTILEVSSLIADISVLIEDKLYRYWNKEFTTVLSVPLIYLISKSYYDIKSTQYIWW